MLSFAVVDMSCEPEELLWAIDESKKHKKSSRLACEKVRFSQLCRIKLACFLKIKYSRTRIKETRVKETFGCKKRFHSSAFMQDKSFCVNRTIDKRNYG